MEELGAGSDKRPWCVQAIQAPNADTAQLDTAYDTLRDEDKRRAYDQRQTGASSASGAKRDEGFEVMERGSGELQEWAQSSLQAGGDGKNEALSLANVAGLLSEAISGGRLCAPLLAAVCWLGAYALWSRASCEFKHKMLLECDARAESLTISWMLDVVQVRRVPGPGSHGLHRHQDYGACGRPAQGEGGQGGDGHPV